MYRWKNYLEEKLAKTTLITLATVSETIPWSSPVYFSYDNKLHFYILQDTSTQHVKNLIFFPTASLIVETMSENEPNVQIIGKTQLFSPEKNEHIKKQFATLQRMHSDTADKLEMKIHMDYQILEITPTHVYLFDKEDSTKREEIFLTHPVKNFLTN